MPSLQRVIGFTALATVTGLAQADAETFNITTVFDTTPDCASPCMIPILQSAKCLPGAEEFLADCLCNNITIQSDINICVQVNCNSLLDQKKAFAIENQICAGYPIESRSHVALITAVVAVAISVPVVIARCATRIKLTKKLWPDDYMSLLSLAAFLTIAFIQIFTTTIGSGRHYWNTDLDNFSLDRQLFYAAKVLYVFVQCTGKIAILLLYQRVLVTASSAQWFRIAVKVMLVLTFTIEGTYIFIIAFQCLPVASLWDPSITDVKCLNSGIAFTAGAVLNISSDVILMILPIPPLWKLQTSLRKRAGVAAMLAIASFGIIASLVRIKYLVAGGSIFDGSYYQIDVFAWSLIELLCVVIHSIEHDSEIPCF
ncbi:hypothetical protein TruAng_007690 [Truncatella angustata]|nr:hypothetical protein TruAng_007690 [Truncatella angustata]